MPKLTCAPRKLAWAPMARNVVWLVPSCLQRLSTRVGGPVKLVAGKLIYTAWGSIHLLQQGFSAIPGGEKLDSRNTCANSRRRLWPLTAMRNEGAHGGSRSYDAVVAARGSMDSEWFAWLASVRRFRTPAVETSLAAPAKADVNRDIPKKLQRHATTRRATTTRCWAKS